MQGTQLMAHVADEHRPEVERLYATFVKVSGELKAEENIDSFANALHEAGFLSADALKDFLTYHGLTIGALEATSEGARYQVMTLLGHGAMGEVYLGRDPSLRRTVAVKRVHADLARDPLLLQRFFSEAQVTAQLDHPAIVPVYGLEKDGAGVLSYAMKFVRGITLSRFLEDARQQILEGGKPAPSHSLKARIETFIPVLNALAYAHRRGVVHRDLKPDNVMVGSFGEVLVMDWGIARVLGQADFRDAQPVDPVAPAPGAPQVPLPSLKTSPQLTLAGEVLGTPAYMSPEQAIGLDVDAYADQYSLGLILQELVTLQPALTADTVPAMLARAARASRDPVVPWGPEPIPRELKAIVDRATAPLRAARYPSVAALAEDLKRFLRDESVEADPDRGFRKVARWIGKHRGLAMSLGAGGAILAFAVVVLFVWRGQVALADLREAARAHERSTAALEAVVEGRGNAISEQLHRYEALLEGIAATAQLVLREPAPAPSNAVVYQYSKGKRYPDKIPDYAVESAAYQQPASLHADYSAAWGVDVSAMRARVDQLARAEPTLRDALLRSKSDDLGRLPWADAEKYVLQHGAPLLWTYLHTADGLAVGVPGTWDYDDSPGAEGYDHRHETWWREAMDTHGPFWSITADESGLGLSVNCVETIRDASDQLVAIAGLDIWLGRFVDQMLEIPALTAAGGEAILLDAQGKVLIRESEKDKAAKLTEYNPPTFEHAAALAAMKRQPSGSLAMDDGRMVVWAKLGSAGLTYVILGPEAALLAATAPQAEP